jgi:hypothetical protein
MAMNTDAPPLPTRSVPPALIVLPAGTLIRAPPGRETSAVPEDPGGAAAVDEPPPLSLLMLLPVYVQRA